MASRAAALLASGQVGAAEQAFEAHAVADVAHSCRTAQIAFVNSGRTAAAARCTNSHHVYAPVPTLPALTIPVATPTPPPQILPRRGYLKQNMWAMVKALRKVILWATRHARRHGAKTFPGKSYKRTPIELQRNNPRKKARRNQSAPIKANCRATHWRLFPGKVQAGNKPPEILQRDKPYLQCFS